MAYAPQAQRGLPQAAIYLIGAALVAVTVLVTTLVVQGDIHLFGAQADPLDRPVVTVDPVWRAAEDWELMRRAQSAFVDPVVRSADAWERQRIQQSPYVDLAARSAAAWELQRLQQSGR
jgi:hypothetical protein